MRFENLGGLISKRRFTTRTDCTCVLKKNAKSFIVFAVSLHESGDTYFFL